VPLLPLCFILLLIIFVHEFGHFIVAKYVLKLQVETFSLGIGWCIFYFTKDNTNFKFCIFPVGGYVQLKNQDEIYKFNPVLKIWFYLNGIIFNFLFAIIINLSLVFAFNPGATFARKISHTIYVTKTMVTDNIELTKKVITHNNKKPQETLTNNTDKQINPIINWLFMSASLSILIGFFNLLPIPPLDGNWVLFELLELISFKKLSAKKLRFNKVTGVISLIFILFTILVQIF
jgi:membrane-associated protease RseP (regulator of RpoE activity)